jgi:hypothetical protein
MNIGIDPDLQGEKDDTLEVVQEVEIGHVLRIGSTDIEDIDTVTVDIKFYFFLYLYFIFILYFIIIFFFLYLFLFILFDIFNKSRAGSSV